MPTGPVDHSAVDPTPSESEAPAGPPRLSVPRAVGTVVSLLAAAVLLMVVLPWLLQVPLGQILATIGDAPVALVLAIVVLGAAAVVADGVGLHAALPGMRFGATLRTGIITQALTLIVPGGSLFTLPLIHAAGRRAGLTAAAAVTGVLVASVVDLAIATAIPVLGALIASVAGLGSGLWAGTFGVLGVLGLVASLAVIVVLLHRPTLAALLRGTAETVRTVLSMLGRDQLDVTGYVLDRRDTAVALLRRRGAVLVGAPLLGRALQFAVLLLALQAVGISLPLLTALAVFLLGRTLALLPLTPGGAGITETAAAAVLVGLGAGPSAAAAAAVLASIGLLVVPVLLAVPAWALRPRRPRVQSSST